MRRVGVILSILFVFMAAPAVAQQDRLSIGIARIEDHAQTGASDAFASMVESALGATGRFRVIEREELARLLNPPQPPRPRRGRAREVPISSAPPVDYLIDATIASVGARARTNIGTSLLGGVLSGLGLGGGETHCSNQEATVAVDLRILHAGTREIRHVMRVTETQRAAAVCSGQAEIDVPRLLRGAADRVAADLVTSIYPIQIAAVEADGTVILNYGTGTVQPRAVYAVYTAGQPIRDPGTGQTIGNQEARLGYVRVGAVEARMSRARPIGTLAPQVGALLRPATSEEVRMHERNERRRRSGQR